MDADPAFRTLALVIGIVLVVAGVGLVVTGTNQMEAAEEWDRQTHYCGSAGSFQDASEIECPDNPYAGGGVKVTFGVGLVVVGGLAARYGTQ